MVLIWFDDCNIMFVGVPPCVHQIHRGPTYNLRLATEVMLQMGFLLLGPEDPMLRRVWEAGRGRSRRRVGRGRDWRV